MWNPYLYNEILFNLQGKLDEDAQGYYKSLLSKNNYYINKSNKFYWLVLATIILLPWVLLFFKANWFRIIIINYVRIELIMILISKTASYRFFSAGDFD